MKKWGPFYVKSHVSFGNLTLVSEMKASQNMSSLFQEKGEEHFLKFANMNKDFFLHILRLDVAIFCSYFLVI